MHVLAFLLGCCCGYVYSLASSSLSGLVQELIVELPASGVHSVVGCAHFAHAKFHLHVCPHQADDS
jgi:hypothetical protein